MMLCDRTPVVIDVFWILPWSLSATSQEHGREHLLSISVFCCCHISRVSVSVTVLSFAWIVFRSELELCSPCHGRVKKSSVFKQVTRPLSNLACSLFRRRTSGPATSRCASACARSTPETTAHLLASRALCATCQLVRPSPPLPLCPRSSKSSTASAALLG